VLETLNSLQVLRVDDSDRSFAQFSTTQFPVKICVIVEQPRLSYAELQWRDELVAKQQSVTNTTIPRS
jgi:hypothetical protein